MLQKIFTIILALTTLVANAQEIDLISVSGKALTDTKEPVSDAQIMVNDSVVSVSDASGTFSFRIHPASFYIRAVKDGYESERISVMNPTRAITDLLITMMRSNELNEVVVTASPQIETASKAIWYPSKQDQQYSTNGYQLVDNMNIPDIVSSNHNQSINVLSGQSVQCLINGIEAQPDEVATLSAKDIVRIEFQRTPGGKYVGKGGVMNFITRQYDYGGNVYVSADQGFAYQYGDYLGFANYKKGALTLSVTGSFKWNREHNLSSSNNIYNLNSGIMTQTISPTNALLSSRNTYGRFKISHAKNNHSLNVSVELAANNAPTDSTSSLASYNGILEQQSISSRHSSSNALSPKLDVDYTIYINGNQYLNITGSASYGRNRYSGMFSETGFDDIITESKEHNQSYTGGLAYYYYLKNNGALGVNINHTSKIYSDNYWGNYDSQQKLNTGYTSALIQWQQTLSPLNLFYYVSAGYSYTNTDINGKRDNYWNPVIYYGGNYTINQNQSISLNGNYLHTIFSPEYKNDLVLPSSFFQATAGNPDLGVLKSFQNYLTYNATFNKFRMSVSYDFMVYLDNITNKYYIKDNILYKTLINDGNFYSNRIIFSASYGLFNNSLRLSGHSIAEFFHLKGDEYDCKHNGIRGSLSLAYYTRGWSFKATYTTPYKTFSMSDPAYFKNKCQYGVVITWNHNYLQIEAGAENFADKYRANSRYFDYGSWNMNTVDRFSSKGRNIYVSVTYTLPYGKKTDSPDASYQSTINSAILKPF